MVEPPQKKARVYFGSLEEQERLRLEAGKGDNAGPSAAVQEGIKAGNINISEGLESKLRVARPLRVHIPVTTCIYFVQLLLRVPDVLAM